MAYQTISDDYINKLFEGARFGGPVDNSVCGKRKLLVKSLQNQIDGYWSGHTIYNIMVHGGLLHDAKRGEEKRLTLLGQDFLSSAEETPEIPGFEGTRDALAKLGTNDEDNEFTGDPCPVCFIRQCNGECMGDGLMGG